MVSRRHLIATGLASGLPLQAVFGHGAHVAFTIIEQNARAGTIEVIHRLMVLDLELALTARIGRRITIEDLADESGEVLVEQYVGEYFSLTTSNQGPIGLDWVGMALEVDTLFVYQEAPLPRALTGLVIANQMLTETHPSQVNTVNVTFEGRTQTRSFILGDPPQTVAL